ncbi:OTU deubiquitinase with linear linkage specificity b isoform X4 [Alosa sapidissima]|uniref:OTU deubiquitinase with linear linkage specificity b isoform X4 n=1 Tax=Alosa sapidissima TaxID=34773 RepID=UPI001C08B965|nr:OTU deubiquitinase with linear linkage specificity b isoform X4 [Alosa sapidissima]
MGNCCGVQSENNLMNKHVLVKEKAENAGVVGKSDGTPRASVEEGYKSNAMPGNGSERTQVKSAVPRNEVHPVPVRTMPAVHLDPDGRRDSVKQDTRLQESTLGLPSTSHLDCLAKRAKIQECNRLRFGDDPNVNCSSLREGDAVESCKETAEPNNENLLRLARSMDKTTPAPLSTSQDKAAEQMRSEEQETNKLKVPVSSIMPEDDNSEEDLYRGEDEIEKERDAKDNTCPRIQAELVSEGQCSVEGPVELLSYSQREWRGNTAKSVLIRKGYEMISYDFEYLRRVRGDNYCALRATLFQLLTQSTQLPACIADHDFSLWPKQLLSVKDLVDQWRFPFGGRSTTGGVEQLEHYLQLLKRRPVSPSLSSVAGGSGGPRAEGQGGSMPAGLPGWGGGVRAAGDCQVPHAADRRGAAQRQRARRERARVLLAPVCQRLLPLPQDPSDQPPAACGLQRRARAGGDVSPWLLPAADYSGPPAL